MDSNDQTKTIAAALLAEFERELSTTRKFLERLPEDKLTWRPHEKSMTAGQLALHIAESPGRVLKAAQNDTLTPPDFRQRQQPQNMREVFDLLNDSADYLRTTLPSIVDPYLHGILTIAQGDRVLMSLPRADFLRSIMLNHWYHHRGQFGVYLRLVGAKVPSSYGPSGDEQ